MLERERVTVAEADFGLSLPPEKSAKLPKGLKFDVVREACGRELPLTLWAPPCPPAPPVVVSDMWRDWT